MTELKEQYYELVIEKMKKERKDAYNYAGKCEDALKASDAVIENLKAKLDAVTERYVELEEKYDDLQEDCNYWWHKYNELRTNLLCFIEKNEKVAMDMDNSYPKVGECDDCK